MVPLNLPLPKTRSAGSPVICMEANAALRLEGFMLSSQWGRDILVASDLRVPRRVDFRVYTERATYEVWVEYAAAEPRPMTLWVDGVLAIEGAVSTVTGGWYPAEQLWQRQSAIEFEAGEHWIGLRSDGPTPHIRRIALLPVLDADAGECARVAATMRDAAATGALTPEEKARLVATLAPELRDLLGRRRDRAAVGEFLADVARAVAANVHNPLEHLRFSGPFNGQMIRQSIVARLDAALGFDAFIETGAYLGTTTEMLGGLGRPVLSCELWYEHFLRAATRLAHMGNVRLFNLDSRAFLRGLFAAGAKWRMPCFYLDAHWGSDLPVADEFNLITANCEDFVIFVDDFRHPDPQYGYDRYDDGVELSLEYLLPKIAEPEKLEFFFPAAPAVEETGARRGTLVAASVGRAARRLRDEGLLAPAR